MISDLLNTIFTTLEDTQQYHVGKGKMGNAVDPTYEHETRFHDEDDLFTPQDMEFSSEFDLSGSAHEQMILLEFRTKISNSWLQIQDILRGYGPYFDGPLLNVGLSYYESNTIDGKCDNFYLNGERYGRDKQTRENYCHNLAVWLTYVARLGSPTRAFIFETDHSPYFAETPLDALTLRKLRHTLNNEEGSIQALKQEFKTPPSVLEAVNPKK